MRTWRSIVSAAVIALAACAARGQDAPENQANEAAGRWLALIDSGKYAESWREAAELFQKQLTAEQWESALKSARAPLGALVARKLEDARYTRTLPGAPDGEYVVLQYAAEFEKKKSATETVTMIREKEKWRAAGYFIR